MEHSESPGFSVIAQKCQMCEAHLTDVTRNDDGALVSRCPNRNRPADSLGRGRFMTDNSRSAYDGHICE